MGFSSIKTYNFRNLEDAVTDVAARNIILSGENGQGKTNFLEAVYFLCFASSFRTHSDASMISHGTQDLSVSGTYSFEEQDVNRIVVSLQQRKKSIKLNDSPVQDRKDIVNNIPCIIFSHEDLSFINGPPERRRWFFNQTMILFEPVFIDVMRSYNKILKMRNQSLKDQDRKMVEVLDYQLAAQGLEYQRRRSEAVKEFAFTFEPLFTKISGFQDQLTLTYKPSWKGCESTEDAVNQLRSSYERDFRMGTTTSGPHRDRFRFGLKGRDFTDTASTGQLRLMSLVLRAAQSRFFQEKTGRKPILLLDDVLLELDTRRRQKFLDSMPEYEQAFFTFLPHEASIEYVKEHAVVYTVKEGKIWKNQSPSS